MPMKRTLDGGVRRARELAEATRTHAVQSAVTRRNGHQYSELAAGNLLAGLDRHPDILNRELHLFEAAADQAERGGLPAHGARAAELANEYLRRCAARRTKFQHAEAYLDAYRARRSNLLSYARWSTPLCLGVAAWFVARRFGAPAEIAIGCGVGFVVLGLILDIPLDRWDRLAAAAAEERCPSCGYVLSGLPDSIPLEVVGVPMGPRLCPECATPWPRVPGPNG
jgi:hypothetical protein